MQLLGQEEQALDVEVHHLVPAGFGELVEIRAPGRPGIVDQHVEPALARSQFLSQALDLVHLRKIAGQADHLAGVLGVEFGLGLGQLLALAGGDVDPLAPGGEEAFEQHLADPAAAAGDQRDLAFKAEQFSEIECHRCSPSPAKPGVHSSPPVHGRGWGRACAAGLPVTDPPLTPPAGGRGTVNNRSAARPCRRDSTCRP